MREREFAQDSAVVVRFLELNRSWSLEIDMKVRTGLGQL